MTTHQEDLESARDAFYAVTTVETTGTVRELDAGVRAYLSHLALADNGLVAELRAGVPTEPGCQHPIWSDVEKADATMAKAADALTASQADRTALAAENERLKADLARVTSPEYLTGALEMIGVVDKEWQVRAEAAEAEIEQLRADVARLEFANNTINLAAKIIAERAEAAEARAASLQTLQDKAVEALGPFASVAEWDIGQEEDDGDKFKPMTSHNVAPRLAVGDLRTARSTITAIKEARHAGN